MPRTGRAVYTRLYKVMNHSSYTVCEQEQQRQFCSFVFPFQVSVMWLDKCLYKTHFRLSFEPIGHIFELWGFMKTPIFSFCWNCVHKRCCVNSMDIFAIPHALYYIMLFMLQYIEHPLNNAIVTVCFCALHMCTYCIFYVHVNQGTT